MQRGLAAYLMEKTYRSDAFKEGILRASQAIALIEAQAAGAESLLERPAPRLEFVQGTKASAEPQMDRASLRAVAEGLPNALNTPSLNTPAKTPPKREQWRRTGPMMLDPWIPSSVSTLQNSAMSTLPKQMASSYLCAANPEFTTFEYGQLG